MLVFTGCLRSLRSSYQGRIETRPAVVDGEMLRVRRRNCDVTFRWIGFQRCAGELVGFQRMKRRRRSGSERVGQPGEDRDCRDRNPDPS